MSSRVSLVALALTLCIAAAARPGEARDRESVAARSDFEIFSVGVDGKQRRNLSQTSLEDLDPVLSPNGRRIVFRRWSNGPPDDPRNGSWLMNSDGSGQMKLPGTERLGGSPVWSPDGTRLALSGGTYSPPTGYSYEVVVMRLADGQLTTIENASRPTWAPDGTRLAFLSDPLPDFRAGFRNLSVADADGTNRRVVLPETGISSQPVWSTHGSLVAVTLNGFSLQVIDAETGNQRTVARQGWNPSWSPDGRRLAFANYRGICVTRVARASTRLLFSSRQGYGSVTPRRPVWSPDGRSIAFIAKHQLRVVDVASRRFRVVTRSSTGFSWPGWSPTGRRLYFAARLPA